ncbi:hypothetical protein F4778DRAFT_751702 [Xylariomycetidae sp. FL2044]|nr:hypothetical protein F4778DRAFT_751702 [Xylariomycetidae sp. FL2044]
MTSSNLSSGQSVHRKPLPAETPLQDRPPSLPALPPGRSTEFGFSKSHTLPHDAPVTHVLPLSQKAHIRNPSETITSAPTMGRLHKPAPVQPPPPIPFRESLATPPPPSIMDSRPSPRLREEQRRSSSINSSTSTLPVAHPNPALRQGSPPDSRGRSVSAQPPGSRGSNVPEHRLVSAAVATAAASRPGSSNGSQSPNRDSERRGRLRRSFLPGGRSRSHSRDPARSNGSIGGGAGGGATAPAWILGQNVDYNTTFLANGEKVPELWNENGTVLVHLDPKGSGGNPSFKVPWFVIDYSLVFADLVDAELMSPTTRSFTGRDSLSVADATRQVQTPPQSPAVHEAESSGDMNLYVPVSMSDPGHRSPSDMERLISIRNLFAFLTGQPLVATKSQPTLFTVLLNISSLLKEFEFTNEDGSTFGEGVEMSFSFLLEQTALADVRQSREKTLEALILGERMRSMELYSEAFAHASGKYSAMRELKSPLWEQLSATTRERLERSHFDLVTRQNGVNNRLESFEFPALFSGVANSTSMAEYRDVKYNTWRKSFGRMRQFVLNYYKSTFGSWPPKARSKKNPFTESGLNRLVLKILYSDLCALYDLLVDRESLTTRVIDQNAEDIVNDTANPHTSAMRRVLTEFDQSSPPVLPPIPFDLPKLPSMTSVKENYYELPAKERARLDRLQEYQLLLILNKAYDFETYKLRIPFLDQFKEFEQKEAKGKTAAEMADQRLGYWLFLYVVIQSLPMLVVDAPGLKFTEGVEYFLCQPPKGHPPWMEDVPSVRKRWYEVAGGGGLVELSADAVEFSIEGIYHRSHCWIAAKRWELGESVPPPDPHDSLSPLQAPQSVFTDMDPGVLPSPKLMGRSESPSTPPPGLALRQRTSSPGGRNSAYRSSIALGLEPVPILGDGDSRRGSRVGSARGVSPGQRPSSAMIGRSRSSGNLHAMANASGQGQGPESRTGSRQGSVGGSTFDDILKDMGAKPKKKKGLF